MSLRDFSVIAKIGEGSYSSVHKVKRISDGQEYALKKVRLMALKDKEKQNALNEVRILASINSPYIISYKDAFIDEASNCLCLIMEYADGGDLQQRIENMNKRGHHMEESQVWRAINQLLHGLTVLHNMQIVHRDLKCANIFISSGNYKLGDLNVSKILKRGLAYTQTGTPYYASPEVWRDQPYDSKSDIWSLGCAIYEMCALRPPFQARSMDALYRKVQKGQFERIPSRYSNDLQKFISMCLQLQPNKRPSCQQLLNQPLLASKQEGSYGDMDNNLLETIKLPKNLGSLKTMLPKSKYSNTAPDYESNRIPSRKSDNTGHPTQYRSLMKKNISEKNMGPEIKEAKQNREGQYSLKKDPYSLYYNRDTAKNIELLNKMKEREKQRIALQERVKHSVEREDKTEERKVRPSYVIPPKESVKLPVLSPQKPVYEYVRPSWWG